MPSTTYTEMSTQFAAYYTVPRGRIYAMGSRERKYDFDYTVAGAGVANDTVGLTILPPKCTLYMIESWFEWTGHTSGQTISIGWSSYTDEDGNVVAASAAGLISGLVLTTASTWSSGMLLTATPDDSKPVVNRKRFNNRDAVEIFATLATQAPADAATFNGCFNVLTP